MMYPTPGHFASWKVVALVGGVGCSLLVIFVVVAILIRRSRLNWYEQNLVEAYPEIIRYRRESSTSFQLCDMNADKKSFDSVWSQFATVTDPTSEQEFCVPRLYVNKSCSEDDVDAGVPMSSVHIETVKTKNVSMFQPLDRRNLDKKMYEQRPSSKLVQQDTFSSVQSDDNIMGPCGALNLTARHDHEAGILYVTVIKASEVTAIRHDSLPNTFVRIRLIKPTREKLEKQPQFQVTKTINSTQMPVFNETFQFTLVRKLLNDCLLEAFIYDIDSDIEECIGYCSVLTGSLEVPLNPDETISILAEILPPLDDHTRLESYGGDVLMRVSCLQQAQKLQVQLMKARNLPCASARVPDPRVTISLIQNGRRTKTKSTARKRNTLHPVFNEQLIFNVPRASLCDTVLCVEVVDQPTLFVTGRVVASLDLKLSAFRPLWREMIKGEFNPPIWHHMVKAEEVSPGPRTPQPPRQEKFKFEPSSGN